MFGQKGLFDGVGGSLSGLAEELERRRAAIKAKGKKWVRKGDQIKAQEAEKKAAREKLAASRKRKREAAEDEPTNKKVAPDKENTEVLMTEEQTKRRLRELGEPVHLFGETQTQRFNRLKEVELIAAERKQTGSRGQKNDYQQVIMNAVEKELELAMATGGTGGNVYEKHLKEKKMKATKYDTPRTREECDRDEDFILFFFKRMLREWERMCLEMPDSLRRSVAGKKKAALQGQCRRDMRSLFKLLKKRTCQADIVRKLTKLVNFCLQRDYIEASKMYFELAIGNAPWPVGVTAPGIHERAGRTKIEEMEVAHVLNNEVQRKYIHAIERIMKFAQEKYPSHDITRNFNVDQDILSKFIK